MEFSKLEKCTLKKFLIFQEMELSNSGLTKLIFWENPLGFFIFVFSDVFIFTIVLRVSSLLIAFFHVTNFASFLLGASFLYCCTASAADLKQLFLLSGVFYLTLHPDIWCNLLLSRFTWEPAVLLWRLQGFPLQFETQTQLICLFESHSV